MSEMWKDIPEYEGLYAISNQGRIKSLPRKVNTKGGAKRVVNEAVLSLGKNWNGYPLVCLSKNHEKKYVLVHRLVAQCFLIQNGKKWQVNHKDGTRDNNHVDNLEWVTPSENTKHGYITKDPQ